MYGYGSPDKRCHNKKVYQMPIQIEEAIIANTNSRSSDLIRLNKNSILRLDPGFGPGEDACGKSNCLPTQKHVNFSDLPLRCCCNELCWRCVRAHHIHHHANYNTTSFLLACETALASSTTQPLPTISPNSPSQSQQPHQLQAFLPTLNIKQLESPYSTRELNPSPNNNSH